MIENPEKTRELVNSILGAGSMFVAGQSLTRRYLDDNLTIEIHRGHALIVEGAELIHVGKPIEEGITLVDQGCDVLRECSEEIIGKLINNPNYLSTETHGMALMKDSLNWLSEIIRLYRPLLDEYWEVRITDTD